MKYETFLQKFLDQGYEFNSFSEEGPEEDNQIYLRHDIDFSLDYADELSLQEYELGIKSTYFVSPDSVFYNIFEKKNQHILNNIISRGQKIGLHFIPDKRVIEMDEQEQKLFQDLYTLNHCLKGGTKPFNVPFSIHQPNSLKVNSKIYSDEIPPFRVIGSTYKGLINVNQAYFKPFPYYADSRGIFRFGSPLDSEEFKNKKSIHLNLHPIWWHIEWNERPKGKIRRFLDKISYKFYDEIEENYNVCV